MAKTAAKAIETKAAASVTRLATRANNDATDNERLSLAALATLDAARFGHCTELATAAVWVAGALDPARAGTVQNSDILNAIHALAKGLAEAATAALATTTMDERAYALRSVDFTDETASTLEALMLLRAELAARVAR